jgi:prepilin-type N-terminal cleavage/methylation domain-containing protein
MKRTVQKRAAQAGFTLMEVLIAAVMLAVGCVAVMACMMQCQRMMLASKKFESAQLVLQLGEMARPIPSPDQVTTAGTDVLSDDRLNVEEMSARELVQELDMELPRAELEQLNDYTFERTVDETDEEILRWNGGHYAVRSTVRWGGSRYGAKKEELNVIRLWRKKP